MISPTPIRRVFLVVLVMISLLQDPGGDNPRDRRNAARALRDHRFRMHCFPFQVSGQIVSTLSYFLFMCTFEFRWKLTPKLNY
jgi:hypothetical protein